MSFERGWSQRAALGLFAVIETCVQQPPRPPEFAFPDGGLLAGTTALSRDALASLQGLWNVSQDARFGPQMSLRASARGVSLVGDQDGAAYITTQTGCIGETVVLEGNWRDLRTRPMGNIRVTVSPPEASAALCRGEALPTLTAPVALQGTLTVGNNPTGTPITFGFARAPTPTDRRFYVGAHHGACQTADQCGVSENSLESLRRVEILGADAVEVDVQITRDGVPILFHDETFTSRLTRGVYCHGAVNEFTLPHVRALCRLLYGEAVPTLAEGLDTVVRETSLSAVWLDMKTPAAVPATLRAIDDAYATARTLNRRVFIFVGLPDDDTITAWSAARAARAEPNLRNRSAPCLVELDPSDARSAGCRLWGPRWTRGPLPDTVAAVQQTGVLVAFWTVDDESFIDTFLRETTPNMILTDRPGVVLHHYNLFGRTPTGAQWP